MADPDLELKGGRGGRCSPCRLFFLLWFFLFLPKIRGEVQNPQATPLDLLVTDVIMLYIYAFLFLTPLGLSIILVYQSRA